jgi:lipopolysaccharide export system ATP-binding protein
MVGQHHFIASELTKAYRGRQVVKNVSLEVSAGEIVGLLGPNGAGKTTSFYMCVGLVAPESGYVLLDGRDVTIEPVFKRARLGIGYLPQEASVFRKLTVEENIMAILETMDFPSQKIRQEKCDEFLEELGVTHVRKSLASALSGGERRRVEIARALTRNPKFILLDEPFAGIDPIAIKDIQEIIRKLKDRRIGVLITDHNVRETLKICDRAYILVDGTVLEEGTPDEISKSERAKRYYLGDDFSLS